MGQALTGHEEAQAGEMASGKRGLQENRAAEEEAPKFYFR